MTKKIRDLKNILKERNLNVFIEVDGGIKLDNAFEVIEAGADMLVAGSSIFNGNTAESIKEFKRIANKY